MVSVHELQDKKLRETCMLIVYENIEEALENSTMVGITHSGMFHADEVLATAILERAFENFGVVRLSSVPKNVPSRAIVYDMGGGAFDHHQLTGAGKRNNGVPYASAGLVWQEYGMAALQGTNNAQAIWDTLDYCLVQKVDAVDCGYISKDCQDKVFTLSQIVLDFNPVWNKPYLSNQAFEQAVGMMRQVLLNAINHAAATLNAKEQVMQAIDVAEQGVLVLPMFMPWRDSVLDPHNLKASSIQFVVYPSVREGYNWQTVPESRLIHKARKEVPTAWWGLTGKNLQEACGIPDAIFCHRDGFIGAAQSLAGALDMVSF